MKMYFHNPHESNLLKTPLLFFRKGKKSVEKYSYLLDYYLESNNKLYLYIDSYNYINRRSWRKLIPKLSGVYLWAILNKINPFRLRIITNPDLLMKEDVLFMFLFPNFVTQHDKLSDHRVKLNQDLTKIKCKKVVHFTHFNYNSNLGSSNLKKVGVDLIVAENDLKKNSPYFNKYFDWYNNDILVLPFVAKEKFNNFNNFSQRINKAVATGTITLPMDECFKKYFGHSDLHPMRLEIHNNRDSITNYIESYVSSIIEETNGKKNDDQKKYFSFDIVKKYNEYKMFIVPEEISGLPGISFVEGMRCGCAYIGIDDPMYTDLGMMPGVHYISYDGTFVDLINKIKYYQNNPKDLESIAFNGYEFSVKFFTKENACRVFNQKISQL